MHKHRVFRKNITRTPIIYLLYMERFGRYIVSKFIFRFFVLLPIFGVFRREYIKGKFLKQLERQSEKTEIELKESLMKLDVHMDANDDYMVVIVSNQAKETQELDEEEVEK